ncbi:MAG TPA: class C sortase [Clostridiaceae bacterium]|nr:class C sortase [Clostridiaceae bacterium]
MEEIRTFEIKGDDRVHKVSKESSRNWVQKLVLAIVFLIGLSIFLYPTVMDFISSQKQEKAIQEYSEYLKDLESQEIARLKREALDYNEKLMRGATITDPFAENRPQEAGVSYMDMLNIGEVMAYLEIPEIDVYLPIYHGTSDDVLNNGLGHIEQTSLPIGGAGTNSVLTGHRGLPQAKMFRNLDEVEVGDVFYVHSLNEVMAYKVFETVIVPPYDIEKLRIDDEKDVVTLITCDPYMINTNRLLVRGERTEYIPPAEYAEGEIGEEPEPDQAIENPSSEGDVLTGNDLNPFLIGGIIVITLGIIIGVYFFRKRRGKKVMASET